MVAVEPIPPEAEKKTKGENDRVRFLELVHGIFPVHFYGSTDVQKS